MGQDAQGNMARGSPGLVQHRARRILFGDQMHFGTHSLNLDFLYFRLLFRLRSARNFPAGSPAPALRYRPDVSDSGPEQSGALHRQFRILGMDANPRKRTLLSQVPGKYPGL